MRLDDRAQSAIELSGGLGSIVKRSAEKLKAEDDLVLFLWPPL